MDKDNIIGELNIIMINVPDNLTPLEKIRWLYIKVGEIFCYDYNFMDNKDDKVRYDLDYIDRYQTCINISKILNLMINNVDPNNIKSEVIKRSRVGIRGNFEGDHLANLVTLSTGEKLILDLTLDLYLIQSGCQTKQFGYTTMNGDEDIISLKECEEMDKKMGLIKNGEYSDGKIEEVISEINKTDFSGKSFEEIIDYKLNRISGLIYKFRGYQEGKNFINGLFIRMLNCTYKEYNLSNKDGKMITCFQMLNGENDVWYLYDTSIGLIKTKQINIAFMLNNGWKTKSNTLTEMLNNNKMI